MSKINPTSIIVFGATGAGKSSFLDALSGTQARDVGDTLTSQTMDITSTIATVGGKRYTLVDTPGFDDTTRSNAEILRSLADFLEKMMREKRQIGGIIYLHRITDNRVGGAALKMLHIFDALVGVNAMKNVVLVSTMWDLVNNDVGEEREAALKKSFWSEMANRGAVVARHDGSPANALAIVEKALDRQSTVVLALQNELVNERKPLDQTGVGQALGADINAALVKHRKEMEQLRSELEKADEAERAALQRELEEETRALQARERDLTLLNQARLREKAEVPAVSKPLFPKAAAAIRRRTATLIPQRKNTSS